jgi:ankyrin repeat protein
LIQAKIDANSKDEDGWTLLFWAAQYRREAVVKLLPKKGTDVKIECRGGSIPLQVAALSRHEGVEQLLVIHRSSEPEDFCGL